MLTKTSHNDKNTKRIKGVDSTTKRYIYARFFTMNNTIEYPSQKRTNVTTAIVLLVIFVAIFIGSTMLISRIGNTTLDGDVAEVTGELVKFETKDQDEDPYITLRVNDVAGKYNPNPLRNALEDKLGAHDKADKYLEELVGKTITLYIPQHPSSTNNVWVLGLVVDGETIVDYNTLIPSLQENNQKLVTIFVVCAAVTAIAACVLIILRTRMKPTTTYVLSEKFAEFFGNQQPTYGTEHKGWAKLILAESVVLLAYLVVCIVLSFFVSEATSDIIFAVLAGLMFVEVVTIVVIAIVTQKKTREMYKDGYPFDSTDFCLLPVGKKMRKQIIESMKAFRAMNPDLYADGGNTYDILFTDHGVEAYRFEDEEDDEVNFDENNVEPFADEKGMTEEKPVAKNVTEGRTPDVTLDYDQLNFEALPYYNVSMKPIVVVVKSRIDTTAVNLPSEFKNDIHLHLDINLLSTLAKYDVRVQGLDKILGDLPTLLTQNAHTRMKFTKLPDNDKQV